MLTWRGFTTHRLVPLMIIGGAGIVLLPMVAQACAACWIGASSPEDPTSQAFNGSVLFLMAMPYVVVGAIAGWLYSLSRMYRREHPKKPGILRAP